MRKYNIYIITKIVESLWDWSRLQKGCLQFFFVFTHNCGLIQRHNNNNNNNKISSYCHININMRFFNLSLFLYSIFAFLLIVADDINKILFSRDAKPHRLPIFWQPGGLNGNGPFFRIVVSRSVRFEYCFVRWIFFVFLFYQNS